MLEPDGRAALTEQLRPPSGFHLAHAVATTFTLDLTTALSVPLAFAAHRVRDSKDPIAILDAVRRAAAKIDVFAQAGQVFEPRVSSDLFALLEPMIHPVRAPRDGLLFHPKTWVLEYTDGSRRMYRMLCASRNLTNDRSWDLVVRLDGSAGTEPTEQGAPLAFFLQALAAMSVQPIPADRAARISALADSIRYVEWERPPDVRSLRFLPLGLSEVPQPPLHEVFDGIRHGIMSPFLSDEGIRRVIPPRSTSLKVLARREQLDRLRSDTLKGIEALILDDAANDDESTDDEESHAESGPRPHVNHLAGLHAKAYVLDRRSGSHLFIGSANATEAGFGGNVEFLVEFEGPQPKLGVDALLGESSPLRALTVAYEPIGDVEPTCDDEADYRIEQTIRALAARRYQCVVTADDGNIAVDPPEPRYAIKVSADRPSEVVTDLTTRINLLTRPANTGEVPGAEVSFAGLALTDITPFLVIRVTDGRGVSASTVVAAALVGDIDGRQDAVIARQLADRGAFMKLLALLLALDGGDGTLQFDAIGGGAAAWGGDGSGLFETLVRAIGVEHGGLDDVKRIVDHVRAAENRRPAGTEPVLPARFDELWDVVWAAYRGDGNHDG